MIDHYYVNRIYFVFNTDETTYATPAITCEAQFNSAGDTTNSLAWSGTITTAFIFGVMIGIELDASPWW